jgi:PST family polysaccharide transporter
VVPVTVASSAGSAAIGFVTQAGANARRPLIVVEAVSRVSFPHFSRLQASSDELRRTVLGYLAALQWVLLLWAAVLIAAGHPLVELVYGRKWLPAVHCMQVFTLVLPFEVVGWVMGFAFAATNRNWTDLRIVIGRSIALLLLVPPLVTLLGIVGVAWATLAAGAGAAVLLTRAFMPGMLRAYATNLAPLAALAALSAAAGRLATRVAPSLPPVSALAGVGVAAGLFLALSLALPRTIREHIRTVLWRSAPTAEPVVVPEPVPADLGAAEMDFMPRTRH